MAGIAHRVVLTPATCAHGNQEAVGLDDAATRCLDANRPGYQHRPVRYHLHPRPLAHGLSARITTSFSVRHPRLIWPVAVSHPARAESTGPNVITWEAMTSASNPVARNEFSDLSTPDSADCTSNIAPAASNSPAADSHNGSRTNRPSTPASQARAGPAVIGMTSMSPAGGVGT